jgi:(S)-2-hydroxyglutarate dehydrogenase
MADPRADLIVVGGGILGLATALRLLEARPGLGLVVLEKEPGLATHQTGRNSGVIHSPNVYAPGSRKAVLCGEGREAAIAFADAHGIPYELCGELIVATREEELPRLEAIRQRALANGAALAELGPEQIREVEPAVVGLRALHVTSTGIIDWGRFARALAAEVRERGGEIRTGAGVTAIRREPDGLVAETAAGPVAGRNLIACAGLHADRIAAMTGDGANLRIVPFRAD